MPTTPSIPPDLQDQGLGTQDSPSIDLQDQAPKTEDSPPPQCPVPNAQCLPLPVLSPTDAALLDLFIAAHESLHRLSEDTGTPVRTLTAWADSPATAPWVARFKAERITYRRGLSLAYLESIVKEPLSPVEGRRAANSLLKYTSGGTGFQPVPTAQPSPRTRPRRATESARFGAYSVPINDHRTSHRATEPLDSATDSLPTNPDTTPEPTARPRGPRTQDPGPPPPPARAELFTPTPGGLAAVAGQPLPDPAHPAETVAHTIIAALTTPDAPGPGAGAFALHNFHHQNAFQRDTNAPDRTLAHLKAQVPDAFIIKSIEPGSIIPSHSSGWCAHEAIIETQANERLLLRIILHQPSWGTFTNCWMLANLTIRAPHIPYTPYLHPTTKDWPKGQRPRAP